MTREGRRVAAGLAVGLLVGLVSTGCEGPDLGFPFDFERMLDQPRYDPYGASAFFEDGMAMRVPPSGTVAYRPLAGPGPFARPVDPWPEPPPVTAALLRAGRDQFEAICGACHGVDGRAQTPVAESMRLRRPPSLHAPRLRALSSEAIHAVIEQGYGLMPSYAGLLLPRERWAVALYAKVLQASQRVKLASLPPDVREAALRALEAGAAESEGGRAKARGREAGGEGAS
ncbi:MAG: cytochrome c [Myxococcota bacterium]